MAITSTGYQAPATSRQGLKPSVYDKIILIGADVDPRLAGQGIFYAIEKDIAAQAYTPEIYAARLKQRGFSDESAQAFTQAYIQKDINIAKDYANGKAAEVYDEQIRKNLTREFEINAKNGVNINKDEAYRQHPMIRPDGPSIEQGGLKRDKLTVAREKLASEINVDKLNDEQKDVYDVFIGNKDKVTLQGKDLNDLYMLERGSRNAGVKKIMIKHAGIEKTGGLTNEELLGIMDVVRGGRIAEDSFEQFSDRIRYAYDLKENGVKFRVVIDEYNDGKKVFDYYSDRNFVDYQQDRRGLARAFDPHSRVQVPSATDEIISQKGNLVNETETNGLRNSVSSIGDNASRADGRQAGDEQILRQGRRDTANASQTKRPAQSDEQMEQQWAAKADGEADAAATGEQMVEKQTLGSLKREYDVERFLRDRENVAAKDAKYGSKVSQKSDLITRWDKNGRRYEYVPPLKEKNYNADFLITKADVAKIRGGKADEAIIEKLRNDLQSSEHMGYDYKTTDSDLRGAYKDEGIDWSKKPQGMNDDEYVNDLIAKGKAPILFSNPNLGSGLVAGTLNSVDEDGNFSPERFAAGFLAGLLGGKAIATGLRKMTPKLYNQILGAAEKMPQMANGNPRLLGKLYSNGKDVSLNSFAGEKAITANVGKLDQAKAMLEKGADEVEIWQKTGWFKDKDGAWKFEIGDSNARLNPEFQSGGRLGELLEHEELFKAYPELKDVRVVKIGGETPDGAALSVKDAAQREKRGIYNVTYNDKTATLVRQDLKNIDDALRYAKGDKSEGAKHIGIRHMKDESAEGYITKNELLNMGERIREYLAKYKEPFIDEKGGHIYEWQNERGERFRAVIGKIKKEQDVPAITSTLSPADEAAKKGLSPNSSLYSHNEIITFYSDRNLKDRMDFKNPKVKYDVNLSEWHKDSAPITKNADGSPKVFYHGSLAKDITEFKSEFDNSGIGFWFADKDYAANHGEGNLYETFLRIKNPLDLREENAKYPFELMREMQRKGLSLEPYGKTSKEAKEFLKQNGYDGIVLDGDYKERPFVIAFDSAQIKHVKNDGNFSDSPNIYKSGKEGYYSPAKNEIGLRDIGDKSTLMHEVQHAIQEIEDFAKGSGAKGENYRLSHGEAEARNVQNRLNLDGKAHPHETFDVNPNETIVSKDGEVSYSRKIEEIKREHPNVERELDESIAAMSKESFNDSNFKNSLLKTIDDFIAETKGYPASGDLARPRGLTTQQLGKSVNLSDKQLAVLKNDIKNADLKVINESKIYFDKIGKDGDKKRFFVDIAEDGSLRVDAYAKSQIDNIPVKQSALEELAGTGDAARLKNMSFEVKAAYRNELDPIKKEAILKTAEYNAPKKEMRGIYNTINNGKESTNIYKDLQKIESAIKLEQGSKKKGGAVHIQKHLNPSAKGAVTQQEVMSIGESVREYIKKYKEPFVDKDGGKIYEWQDKDGVRFRVAVYDKIKKSVGAGSTTRITTTDAYESIITFYSDRNLNGRMDFLDPRLRAETKFEEFKAKNLDENGNIKDGLSLC